jgi:hypothetical protein
VEGFCAFSPDGSKFDLPRTKSNKRSLRPAGRKKSPPQLLLTMMYHLGTGLPWDWRITAGRGSERAALRRMLPHLPAEALIVADAGFMGYELLRALLGSGRHVLIRAGANVRLLRDLGYCVRQRRDTVYLWPLKAQRRRCEPIVLRRIVLGEGRKQMCLLTDIHDRRRLSRGRAKRLYRLRWGVEVMFRSLKQTMERRKLLSRTAAGGQLELQWTVLGMWLLGLMTISAMRVSGRFHLRWSVGLALSAVRDSVRQFWLLSRRDRLHDALRAARVDDYCRRGSKTSRRWPHKKKDRPCGLPKLHVATAHQIQRAQEVRDANIAA